MGDVTNAGSRADSEYSERARRTSRINMRLTPESMALIRAGAAAQDQDITTFVIGAAVIRARELLANQQEPMGNVGLAAFE